MRTTAQRRKQVTMLKAASIVMAAAVVLMPKLDDLNFPEVGFPLVTTAVAAEAGDEYSRRP